MSIPVPVHDNLVSYKQVLDGGDVSKDGIIDPNRVLTLMGSDGSDPHVCRN